MSIGKFQLPIPITVLGLLASVGCRSAQRPTTLLPAAQASAPAVRQNAALAPASNPVPPLAHATDTQPKPDPILELVEKVEKDYQAGEDSYQAGQIEAAKQNFDRALQLLLESPFQIRSDERLQREFDRVLDAVNSLDLEALERGEAVTEQKSEPAPIDEANEVTYPVDPNIRAKAEAEVKATHSDLPLMMTDQVASYINYFSSRGRGTFESALARSGRYQEMIRRILAEEGVPQDLIYLAQAESGFHPFAVSRAGARGIWQFMASRARGYGLERDWWVDERQDPEKATRAAARHLRDLYHEFGDWYLAMAAYNSGPGTVQQAVKRTGYADYWELYKRNVLPRETRNYVPIILAVTIMAKNPAQYGLENVVPERPAPYDRVPISYAVDLRLVADCVDASASTLQDLNPTLLRWTTPKNQPFDLHLPAGSKDRYLDVISVIPPDMRVWWRYHQVEPGETLGSIARTYHTPAKAIAEVNSLHEEDELPTGSKLIVPVTPGKYGSSPDAVKYARRATPYRVRKGDTVSSVADNFEIPAAMIRRWNRLSSDSLRGRHLLYLHLPLPPGAGGDQAETSKQPIKNDLQADRSKKVLRHKVQPGETLYSIAKSHNTTVAALKQNNGNLATLRPGMILLISPSMR
ncbi:MAG TPA: LysM peptidoglycan-binding domain-containing protein [Terriglobales bacterium]|nr:LysM peptidoglycan-binding domain-containing protein [Terriglobales bacterium]